MVLYLARQAKYRLLMMLAASETKYKVFCIQHHQNVIHLLQVLVVLGVGFELFVSPVQNSSERMQH